MSRLRSSILDRLLLRRSLRRWADAARAADTAELDTLRAQRNEARMLRGKLDALVHVADGRLALPRVGSNAFSRPSLSLIHI